MADVVDRKTRSRMMAGIRARDTKPERIIRSGLFRLGFRYRLHSANLPGRPDLVFPSRRAAIFVNGCFWHGHDCRFFRMPTTRRVFWEKKIRGNRRRDEKNLMLLANANWRTLVVWECAMRGKRQPEQSKVIGQISSWLDSHRKQAVIRERTPA